MLIKGFTYGYSGSKGSYQSADAIASQDEMYNIGINYMCLAFSVKQDDIENAQLYFNYKDTVTEKDIKVAVKRAHAYGIKVCLKPMLTTNQGLWNPNNSLRYKTEGLSWWKEWFHNYCEFILHYAQIAEDNVCEMLCIGNETLGGVNQSKEWSVLIQRIRQVYHGKLIYHVENVEDKLQMVEEYEWLRGVEYLGVRAFFKRGNHIGDTLESMIFEWRKLARMLKAFYQVYKKPMVFMESGCESKKMYCMSVSEITGEKEEIFEAANQEVQANYYDSVLSAFHDQPWFAGAFWWEWDTYTYERIGDESVDTSFRIDKKMAHEVIRHWYLKVL